MSVFGSVANVTRGNGDFAIDVSTRGNAVPTPSFPLLISSAAQVNLILQPPPRKQRPYLAVLQDQTPPLMENITEYLLSLPTVTFAAIRFRLRQPVSTVPNAAKVTTISAQAVISSLGPQGESATKMGEMVGAGVHRDTE
jgi:hypothetical protein